MPTVAALLLATTLGVSPVMRVADLPMPPLLAFPTQPPPVIDATAWMVWSVEENAELASLDPDTPYPPASITKLMTAMVALQRAAPDNRVVISGPAASTPLGYVGQPHLLQGEVWTVRDLLTLLLVQSGNDAAVALAEHVSGSVDAFVDAMNTQAAALGMVTTRFENPSGLDAEGHEMSARDLIVMGRAALAYPEVLRIARVKHASFEVSGRLLNLDATDRDLGVFPGLLGLKTGDTLSAGQTMLAYAINQRGGMLTVVLGSGDRRLATRELLAWSETTLGLKDYFFAPIVGSDLELTFPDWYLVRLRAAGGLPTGDPATRAVTPLSAAVDQGLRDLLPELLGGGAP